MMSWRAIRAGEVAIAGEECRIAIERPLMEKENKNKKDGSDCRGEGLETA